MPIVDSTVREAWLAHVHQVTEDDTLDDIEAGWNRSSARTLTRFRGSSSVRTGRSPGGAG